MINKKDACQALIDGKIIIAYFGNNGDYQYPHLATPIEIRLFGNLFCTYTSHGTHTRKLTESNAKNLFIVKWICRNIIIFFVGYWDYG